MTTHNWIDLKQDADTGIETLRAHFEGHAYDPHWHDSYLVGVTEQGVQQFNCRRARHQSTPGKVFLLEPGDIHDGEAPTEDGFTYRMLYLDPQWLQRELGAVFDKAPDNSQLCFANTLATDVQLASATSLAFENLHRGELKIVRQTALDGLLERLTRHLHWRACYAEDPRLPLVAQKAREYLHAHAHEDIGLEQLAAVTGVDRFRLTRAFKAAYGMAPHAYLVQLRLATARRMLARGELPAVVAMTLGFADQSHLGRWFVRAYGLTPAMYRTRCSNLPDR
ncbi:AraC family transcriptional regulator [Pseudomonas sp. GM55]|uniref:AraC family transcriptional regulator n=1 Tax=Pseudomonas sp. GM55 TaxID=1144333 RepID=UPI000270C6C5|nr:AraC family transcriptional regulator [Pseudomonas sp. GM55]EJM68039.1 DNA-binding domain-containing protein, AraC-type [Pseudomonas sp. GM55]